MCVISLAPSIFNPYEHKRHCFKEIKNICLIYVNTNWEMHLEVLEGTLKSAWRVSWFESFDSISMASQLEKGQTQKDGQCRKANKGQQGQDNQDRAVRIG
jgi:hypothetical protein